MNNVILIGRLTKDPEYHVAESGLQICRFQMAVDREAKSEEKKADYPRVIVFGTQAENCNKFIGKGKLVGVKGRLQTGSYEKDGQKYYTTDVIAERVEFLSPMEKKENQQETFAMLDESVPF